VDRSDLVVWLHGALGELYATIAAQGLQPSGPSGGLFASELFNYERGEVTMFVPLSSTMPTVGRVSPLIVPAAEVAIAVHDGTLANLQETYGALGAYVATQALGLVGPVREYYLVDARATSDTTQWRTQLAWPIFQTAKPRSKPEG
ncbi:MAG TPA: GyrI-like domain-containing protein, partial [Aggregatilineales bacterium]|nr:GyrI-like domain-containing protein [Aggregatilineales bacterium]